MNFPYKDPLFPERNSLFGEIKDVIVFLLRHVRWILFLQGCLEPEDFPSLWDQWWTITALNSLRDGEAPDWSCLKSYWASQSLFPIVVVRLWQGGEYRGDSCEKLPGASPVSHRANSSHERFSVDFSSSSSCSAGIYERFATRRRWTLWSMVPLMH